MHASNIPRHLFDLFTFFTVQKSNIWRLQIQNFFFSKSTGTLNARKTKAKSLHRMNMCPTSEEFFYTWVNWTAPSFVGMTTKINVLSLNLLKITQPSRYLE